MTPVPLEEIADVIRGVTFSKADATDMPREGLMPVLRAGNIADELDVNNDLVFVDQDKISPKQVLQESDIVVCMSSGSASVIGKSAILRSDWNGSFGAFLATVRPDPRRTDPAYVSHFFRSPVFRRWASGSSGIAIKNIRASDLKKFLIPLPPLEEQKRIAAILDQADTMRRLRKRAIDRLDNLGQAIFHEMFGAFENDLGGWRVARIEEVIEDAKIGLVRGSKDMSEEFPIPYLRMDSIETGGGLRLSDLKRVNASAKELKDYALKKGDFLFNTRNSRELVGKTAVVWEGFDGVYNNNILRCRFADDMTGAFLDAFLRTQNGKRLLEAVKSGTTSVFAIYQKSFMALTVPCPPRDLQQKFSDRLEMIAFERRKLEVSLTSMSALFSSLQNRAFKGEL